MKGAQAEAVRTFGVPHAALYPFLRREVSTPHGHGKLVRVFADTPTAGGALVLFERPNEPDTAQAFRCADVWPV